MLQRQLSSEVVKQGSTFEMKGFCINRVLRDKMKYNV